MAQLPKRSRADYIGQISRDTIRLLDAGATPTEIMTEAVRIGVPKPDYGPGHELANAADCLALAEATKGDARALPLVQGLAGVSETTRDRPPSALPLAQRHTPLPGAIEAEDVDAAMGAVVAAIEDDRPISHLRSRFIEAAASHHLSYGHGAIYVQKKFELLEQIGWDKALSVLPHLAETVAYSTREDTLPYMARFMRSLAEVDLEELALRTGRPPAAWSPSRLANELLDTTEEPTRLAAAAIGEVDVEGLLDGLAIALSRRLLRYDTDLEFANENFGWLDITHGLTYTNAARWAWRAHPGPDTARLALFAAWLVYDTGRVERRLGVTDGPAPAEVPSVGQLITQALDGRAGSFIVAAHLVKTAIAAAREAEITGSDLPLLAAARFLAGPRRERFVARNVAESLDFIRSGRPPRR